MLDSIAAEHLVLAQIVDLYTGRPIPSARCEVVDPAGAVIASRTTGRRGEIGVAVHRPGDYRVRVRPPRGRGLLVLAAIVDHDRANGHSIGVTTADENGVIEVDARAPGDVVVRVLLLRTGAS